jgi:hypothetical protein
MAMKQMAAHQQDGDGGLLPEVEDRMNFRAAAQFFIRRRVSKERA